MKKNAPKLAASLFTAALIAGCSSGGGTSTSGDGLGVQTTQGNLLLTAQLVPNASGTGTANSGVFTIDAIQRLCNPQEVANGAAPIGETGRTTATASLTITSRDLMDESGLTPIEFFPEGLTFTRYKVSYTSPNAFAPTLRDRVFQQTMVLPNGNSTGTFSVIIADADVIQEEFAIQSSGSPASYNVKVQAFGAEFNGTPISVSAESFVEFGDVDTCPAPAAMTPETPDASTAVPSAAEGAEPTT